jgi:hypothetical protein
MPNLHLKGGEKSVFWMNLGNILILYFFKPVYIQKSSFPKT